MTRVLLVRHASCAPVGRLLAGRAPGVHLDAAGAAQAEQLAARLAGEGVDAVYSSPLERAWETAAVIAHRAGLEVQRADGLVELDFGEWTGRAIAELEGDACWRRFNAQRAVAGAPGGELAVVAQARAVAELLRLAARHEVGCIVAVSHADIIRSVLVHILGAPLDNLLRLEIAPASVSVVALEPWGAQVVRVNDTGHLDGR